MQQQLAALRRVGLVALVDAPCPQVVAPDEELGHAPDPTALGPQITARRLARSLVHVA
jgi:hypothetical protein